MTVPRFLAALGLRRWNRRTCWRELDFWIAMATLLLPFGFLVQVLRWRPIRARLFPAEASPAAADRPEARSSPG